MERRASRLSYGERRVLEGIAGGHTTSEISRSLPYSFDTIKCYRQRAYDKLGARNGPHAVALAYETGILAPDDPDWDVLARMIEDALRLAAGEHGYEPRAVAQAVVGYWRPTISDWSAA